MLDPIEVHLKNTQTDQELPNSKLRLSRQFQACFFFFFYTKRFRAHKNTSQANMNQQNKNKLTLNNKGSNFLRAQTSKSVKVACFKLWGFLCERNLFLKKKKKIINRLEIVLITSFSNTTDVYPYPPTYREFICTHLFLFAIIYENIFFL